MELISLVESEEDKIRAEELAVRLGLRIIEEEPKKSQDEIMLRFDSQGLALVGDNMAFRGDYTRMLPRLRENNLRGELLVRAAKIKNFEDRPVAIDATAGMGEDALLLAAAGFQVQLFEYNPIIAALLQDTLYRASKVPELSEIVGHMNLTEGNSIELLSKLSTTPELILLDPMFPSRNKSGLIKKKFQLLQRLEQPCTEENELLKAAVDAHPRKIIIKRPSKGPYLAGIKPGYSIEGKGIRYDCLALS